MPINAAAPQDRPIQQQQTLQADTAQEVAKEESKEKNIKIDLRGTLPAGQIATINLPAELTKTAKEITFVYNGTEKTVEIPEHLRGKQIPITLTNYPNVPVAQQTQEVAQHVLTPEQTKNLEQVEIRHGGESKTVAIPKEWRGKQVTLSVVTNPLQQAQMQQLAQMMSHTRAMMAYNAQLAQHNAAVARNIAGLEHQIKQLDQNLSQTQQAAAQKATNVASSTIAKPDYRLDEEKIVDKVRQGGENKGAVEDMHKLLKNRFSSSSDSGDAMQEVTDFVFRAVSDPNISDKERNSLLKFCFDLIVKAKGEGQKEQAQAIYEGLKDAKQESYIEVALEHKPKRLGNLMKFLGAQTLDEQNRAVRDEHVK